MMLWGDFSDIHEAEGVIINYGIKERELGMLMPGKKIPGLIKCK